MGNQHGRTGGRGGVFDFAAPVFTVRLAARNAATVRAFQRAAIARQSAVTTPPPHTNAIHSAQFKRVAPDRSSPAPNSYGIIAARRRAKQRATHTFYPDE